MDLIKMTSLHQVLVQWVSTIPGKQLSTAPPF
jgi:hypothetical protein